MKAIHPIAAFGPAAPLNQYPSPNAMNIGSATPLHYSSMAATTGWSSTDGSLAADTSAWLGRSDHTSGIRYTRANGAASGYMEKTLSPAENWSHGHLILPYWVDRTTAADAQLYRIGIKLTDSDSHYTLWRGWLASLGWMTHGLHILALPLDSFGENNACDLSKVAKVSILIEQSATYSTPSVVFGGLWVMPKKTKAQLFLSFDGVYASQGTVATYLAGRGLPATFFTNQNNCDAGGRLTTAQTKALQAQGHLVALYTTLWLGKTFSQQIAHVEEVQTWMAANGFRRGMRYAQEGGSGSEPRWSWDRENVLIPRYLNCWSQLTFNGFSSQYAPNRVYRIEYAVAGKTTIESYLASAIANGCMFGIMAHDLSAGDYANFQATMEGPVATAIAAGTLECLTLDMAFEKNKA